MSCINVAMVGAVDAAKSTLIGVLVNNILDNGNGDARKTILNLKHEKTSGRTSSITSHLVLLNGPLPLPEDPHPVKSSIEVKTETPNTTTSVRLLDLAGHEKYLKTTLRGLTQYFPDYALLLIEANRGVTKMTEEHMRICVSLRIPVWICITKLDSAEPDKLKITIQSTKLLCKRSRIRFTFPITNRETYTRAAKAYAIDPLQVAPVIQLSNITGVGIPWVKAFMHSLQKQSDQDDRIDKFCVERDVQKLFFIYRPYLVPGVGHVVYGIMKHGELHKGDTIKVGPIHKKYHNVKIRSIHNQHCEPVDVLKSGESGCFAIRIIDRRGIVLDKSILKNGRVLIDKHVLIRRIKVNVSVLGHSGTIQKGYQPHIHCANVAINSHVEEIDIQNATETSLNCMRVGDRGIITFRLMSAQFVYPGARLVFRDGRIKGIGIVEEVVDDENSMDG